MDIYGAMAESVLAWLILNCTRPMVHLFSFGIADPNLDNAGS
jgi:hypothetical protein